ncbi:MAG: SUMF1/EgtB/PvdO family nonheme iron enzyme [Chitinispirillales bacterium]|nr:SUMF1/EgtB/PvdO family nonheme iron enzyme [Chitinispirillales bacterium]
MLTVWNLERRFYKNGCTPNGSNRVNRGGSWNNNSQNCRVANRNNNTPSNSNNNLGFRVAFNSKRLCQSG